jgi:hypothetical protein
MSDFKMENFGAEPNTIMLTRKQIVQMYQMIDHFKEQETFALRYQDGKLSFNFTIEFDKN